MAWSSEETEGKEGSVSRARFAIAMVARLVPHLASER